MSAKPVPFLTPEDQSINHLAAAVEFAINGIQERLTNLAADGPLGPRPAGTNEPQSERSKNMNDPNTENTQNNVHGISQPVREMSALVDDLEQQTIVLMALKAKKGPVTPE